LCLKVFVFEQILLIFVEFPYCKQWCWNYYTTNRLVQVGGPIRFLCLRWG